MTEVAETYETVFGEPWPNKFAHLASVGFLADLLPIIPPGAQLSAKSDVDPADRGKVPGKIKRDGSWIGFKNWTQHTAAADDLQTWGGWEGASVGIQSRRTPAIDIDVTDAGLADAIEAAALKILGPAPKRIGKAPKRLLPYRCEAPGGKRRLVLTPRDGGRAQAVEYLAVGQQFVARGIHPGTGEPYTWHGGDLETRGYDGLPEITTAEADDFFAEVADLADAAEYDVTTVSTGDTAAPRSAFSGACSDADAETMRSALAKLGNKEPDRHEWFRQCCAVKAGLHGDDTRYPIFTEWCRQWPDNTDDDARNMWGSIAGTSIGADYVLAKARAAGWDGWRDAFRAHPILPPGIHQLPANFDRKKIPVRDFILGRRLLRGAVSELVGAPGVLKSMLGLCSAAAIVTRKAITNEHVRVSGNVLVYDAEDPIDEFERRIAGLCTQHSIAIDDLRPGLFYRSGQEAPLFIASKQKDVVQPNEPEVGNLIKFILANKIVAVFMGPLVGLHRGVTEDFSVEMEAVMAVARRIASEGNCAVVLTHHTTKSAAKERDGGAGDPNIGRGSGAVVGAARIVHTVVWIDKKTVETLSLPSANIIRLDSGKGNYSPRGQDSLWFEVKSVDVGNGAATDGSEFVHPDAPPAEPSDTVGVPVIFDMAKAEREARGVALAKQSSLVGVIAAAMPADSCSVSAVVGAVMVDQNCKERKARDLVGDVIPATEIGITTIINGRTCVLRRERKGDHVNAPVELIRTWAA